MIHKESFSFALIDPKLSQRSNVLINVNIENVPAGFSWQVSSPASARHTYISNINFYSVPERGCNLQTYQLTEIALEKSC